MNIGVSCIISQTNCIPENVTAHYGFLLLFLQLIEHQNNNNIYHIHIYIQLASEILDPLEDFGLNPMLKNPDCKDSLDRAKLVSLYKRLENWLKKMFLAV